MSGCSAKEHFDAMSTGPRDCWDVFQFKEYADSMTTTLIITTRISSYCVERGTSVKFPFIDSSVENEKRKLIKAHHPVFDLNSNSPHVLFTGKTTAITTAATPTHTRPCARYSLREILLFGVDNDIQLLHTRAQLVPITDTTTNSIIIGKKKTGNRNRRGFNSTLL